MIETFDFIGRFHPVILHLPIGIFLFVFLLEIISRLKKTDDYRVSINLGLLSGFVISIGTCITGYILAETGDYQGELVDQHKYLAIAMTIASGALYFLQKKQGPEKSKLYFPSFCLVIVLLTITGHQGGSITHGDGFLWRDQEQNEASNIVDINSALAYKDIIQPILKKKCVSCHNESKTKGDLMMTSPERLALGGKNGVIYVAGDAKKSTMIQRIHLPLEEKEHMPPKSKKQLSEDEISLIEWWINEGASYDASIGSLKPSEKISAILDKYAQAKDNYFSLEVEMPTASKMATLLSAGIVANTLSKESPFIDVSLSHRKDLTKSTIQNLKSVNDQVSILDLGFSNVTDKMLSSLSSLKNLRNLQLQGTQITDETVKSLSKLKYLKTLNLYDTDVTDDIVEALAALPALQSVYLWQTKLTTEGVAQLQTQKPLLDITFQQDDGIFGDASLRPPLIVAKKDIFKDSLEIEFDLNFKNVDFYYTVDGSEPDSLSLKYTDPFTINNSALIKVISSKEGWGSSEVAEKQFIQAKYTVANVALNTKPADKYKGEGGKTITDFKKGTSAFTDGNWLGFEGKHMNAVLDLGKTEEISSVSISALDAFGSWIFYPTGMTIWTSKDGSNYTFQKETSFEREEKAPAPSMKNFTESFEPEVARYVKIKVKSQLNNPEWHPNPGGKSWLFIDEVLVN